MEKTWTIKLSLEEDGSRTACTASLTGDGAPGVVGHGYSRRNPNDEPDMRIGEDVAASRACSNLAHELLEQAAGMIETHTSAPTHLTG
ncbi:DUF1876 domain-containing protein [Streptomyces sp. ME01-24h]|nr:DUF1876 domain-containing protein [Streptomyces sp. ME19-03-3]MDX3215214.1 DUF1876 domain-containing protein [Streptomyces sp. ME02-6991-2B]MDX3357852.1 DUF1876 domain-containing protein [Streptomyces sp. ME01-24h]